MRGLLEKLWSIRWMRRFLAMFRLSLKAVCEESASMGSCDFHDYTDAVEGSPSHMVLLTCKRCGKKFYI
jgi:hypothetical protein